MRRCLAKDAKRLLRDVGDVRIELEEALAGGADEEPGGADPGGGRRLWWFLVCVALVAAASGAGIGLLAARGRATPLPVTRATVTLPANQQLDTLGSAAPLAIPADSRPLR